MLLERSKIKNLKEIAEKIEAKWQFSHFELSVRLCPRTRKISAARRPVSARRRLPEVSAAENLRVQTQGFPTVQGPLLGSKRPEIVTILLNNQIELKRINQANPFRR